MKSFYLALFICCSALSIGQTKYTSGTNDVSQFSDNVQNNGVWITNSSKKDPIKGSVYLYDGWQNISTVYFGDQANTLTKFNYNIKYDRFEARFSQDSVLVLNPLKVTKVIVNNREFKRMEDPSSPGSMSFFEIVCNSDNVVIIKQHRVSKKEGSFNPMTQQQIKPDEYIKSAVYFVSKDKGEKFKKTKLKKSTVLSLVDSEKREAIANYVKEEKLSYKDEQDLHKILEHSNSI
ncbi:MAG: hypothetical protein BM564_10465 [Bacteroidetes bacterium MedPE-SWsnd-G2]|nr:MAG: hypothetical protein BM564_10465 [Bacteroidetes bacterium MedPE-SWsnd-G2]